MPLPITNWNNNIGAEAYRRKSRVLWWVEAGAKYKGHIERSYFDLLFQVEDFVDPNGKISLQREETPSNR